MTTTSTKRALVVCDMQPDLLKSLDEATTRIPLLDATRTCLAAARQAGWTIAFSGLQFSSGYASVDPGHKLYGALKRLHDLNPGGPMKFFLKGQPGAAIESSLLAKTEEQSTANKNEHVVWRDRHWPDREQLTKILSNDVQEVFVIGIKAGFAVQAMVQLLCDESMTVHVVRDCVQDDDPQRREAVLDHVLPGYATVISLTEMIDEAVGLNAFTHQPTESDSDSQTMTIRCCSDCGRSGLTPLFLYHLQNTKRQTITWCPVPTQTWFTQQQTLLHQGGKTFRCPLGKRIVDFCDEPQFSRISMFVKGREWLDEKEKLWQLVPDLMPDTLLLQQGQWRTSMSDVASSSSSSLPQSQAPGPWFVKEVNKNGGRAVQPCHSLEDCQSFCATGAATSSPSLFVVQRHIDRPLLTIDGRKCHLKVYSLMVQQSTTNDDNQQHEWKLYTYADAFLCVSPNVWSTTDLSPETQVTIRRDERICYDRDSEKTKKEHNGTNGVSTGDDVVVSFDYYRSYALYQRCQQTIATILQTAIHAKKLTTRGHACQKQFEIFSTDFMVDTTGKAWLIECNFTPVLFDPIQVQHQIQNGGKSLEQILTTKGLRSYYAAFQRQQESGGAEVAVVNDHVMIRDAMEIVFVGDTSNHHGQQQKASRWDLAGEWTSSDPN